ncbi:MucB/RseB C-terminal domain-containing protein [Neiella marina]|uniref:MucB/RseB C-terminal domain-containing protein n=1 Tax=Neiella holothuriorum TaxID=2870530 RepID=A0ABS7EB61_9GAMM|nr:MucB/RseB C-terminal domain-containing protein [Neiella holothuriorum]MBW8189574.1 MucB/RseB C-terminal domain-containing protein [Neiella holothuriorum]
MQRVQPLNNLSNNQYSLQPMIAAALFLFSLLVSLGAHAEPPEEPTVSIVEPTETIATVATAEAWLQRMGQTFQAANYSLSVIRVNQQHFEPIAIEHGIVDGETLVYVNYLNGPEREILHRDGVVTYFQHDEPPYSVAGQRAVGPIPRAFITDVSILKRSYQFVLGGRNRVLGRSAQLIRIEPNEADRYAIWVWLDAEHGMLLRADIVSPSGEPLEHIQVVSMQYSETPSAVVQQLAALDLPAPVPLMESQQVSGNGRIRWVTGYLPEGFELIGRDRHRLGVTKDLVDYQLYSDGISSVSVYVGSAADEKPGQAGVSKGATHLVTVAKDGVEVAVIGKLPIETITRIVESVHPVVANSSLPGKAP